MTEGPESETWYLRIKKNPALSGPFKDAVKCDSDLTNASIWPESEVEIISAVISRFMCLHIFGGPLYGVASHIGTSIENIGGLMAKQTQPKKGRR